MRAHSAQSGGGPRIQQDLHDLPPVAAAAQSHAETLPVAARPPRVRRQCQAGDNGQQLPVPLRLFPSSRHYLRRLLELLPAHRGLDVGHLPILGRVRHLGEVHCDTLADACWRYLAPCREEGADG